MRFGHVLEFPTPPLGPLGRFGPGGFTIAGEDGQFVPAQAEIRDQTVVVWNDSVTPPVAVRNGWGYVQEVNLIN